jgi:hypothetical protein
MDTIVAASCVVGLNLLADKWIEESPYWRRVSRIGICGSTAVGDNEFVLKYGDREVGRFRTSTVGAGKVPQDDDMQVNASKMLCGPNTKIRLECVDAPATNPIWFILDVQEIPNFRPFNRRGGY